MRDYYSDSEANITLELLKSVEVNSQLTQRSAANELGIALGLVNTYLKRCVRKGLIKIRQAPKNRYAYYLTPQGLTEKSRLTAEFLSQSLNLFRQARADYADLMRICVGSGWRRVAIYGLTDLTEVAIMCSTQFNINFAYIYEEVKNEKDFMGIKVVNDLKTAEGPDIDAFIFAKLDGAQEAYDNFVCDLPTQRILTPKLLEISQVDSLAEDKVSD